MAGQHHPGLIGFDEWARRGQLPSKQRISLQGDDGQIASRVRRKVGPLLITDRTGTVPVYDFVPVDIEDQAHGGFGQYLGCVVAALEYVLLMGGLFGAQRGLVALPDGPSVSQRSDTDLQLGMVDGTVEAVEHAKRKLGELEKLPLAPAGDADNPVGPKSAFGQHIGTERMDNDRRTGLGGDLGRVADVIVVGVADQDGVCPVHLIKSEAKLAHPWAPVIEGVQEKNSITEAKLIIRGSEPADGQDIGVRIDGTAQHRRTAVAEDPVMVHVRLPPRQVDPLRSFCEAST